MYLHEIYPTVPHLSKYDFAFRFYNQDTIKIWILCLGHMLIFYDK